MLARHALSHWSHMKSARQAIQRRTLLRRPSSSCCSSSADWHLRSHNIICDETLHVFKSTSSSIVCAVHNAATSTCGVTQTIHIMTANCTIEICPSCQGSLFQCCRRRPLAGSCSPSSASFRVLLFRVLFSKHFSTTSREQLRRKYSA